VADHRTDRPIDDHLMDTGVYGDHYVMSAGAPPPPQPRPVLELARSPRARQDHPVSPPAQIEQSFYLTEYNSTNWFLRAASSRSVYAPRDVARSREPNRLNVFSLSEAHQPTTPTVHHEILPSSCSCTRESSAIRRKTIEIQCCPEFDKIFNRRNLIALVIYKFGFVIRRTTKSDIAI